MNRRKFLGLLAGLPLLGFIKPQAMKGGSRTLPSPRLDLISEGLEASSSDLLKQTEQVVKAMVEQIEGKTVVSSLPFTIEPKGSRLVRWNGAGDSWESNDGGETWTQTGFAPSYSGKATLIEGEEIWLKFNGHGFERVDKPLT